MDAGAPEFVPPSARPEIQCLRVSLASLSTQLLQTRQQWTIEETQEVNTHAEDVVAFLVTQIEHVSRACFFVRRSDAFTYGTLCCPVLLLRLPAA
jgi:hypothetical protein